MNNTDQNIHKLLNYTDEGYNIDSKLENNIMDKVNSQKNYAAILVKSKRKAKIGILVSIILLGVYGFVTYYELFNSTNYSQYSLKAFYPSIFTPFVVIVVYFEMTFGVYILRKETQPHKTVSL